MKIGSDQFCPFSHPAQSILRHSGHIIGLKSLAIIAYLKDNIIFPFFYIDPGMIGVGMLANIIEYFLYDADQLSLYFRWNLNGKGFIAALDRNPADIFKFLGGLIQPLTHAVLRVQSQVINCLARIQIGISQGYIILIQQTFEGG